MKLPLQHLPLASNGRKKLTVPPLPEMAPPEKSILVSLQLSRPYPFVLPGWFARPSPASKVIEKSSNGAYCSVKCIEYQSKPLLGQVTGTQVCIFEVGVAGVDDEIALFEERQQIGDHGIHRWAGGHQHHDRARPT